MKKNHKQIKPKKSKFVGYPLYPASDDIYQNAEELRLTQENISPKDLPEESNPHYPWNEDDFKDNEK